MAQDRYANNTTSYEHPQESNLLNIHKTMQYNSQGQPVARVHVDGINLEGDVIVDTVSLSASTLAALETINVIQSSTPWVITGSVVVSNLPTTSTVYQGTDPWTVTGTVNIGTMPEVEIKNDSGNPVSISKNTLTNSSSNPIYVSNEGSSVVVGDYPAATLTAFDEPLAVGITPMIQAEAMYGLDPDFWVKSQLRGGSINLTVNTTWQVESGTSAGGYARLATSKYMTYQPGQGSMFRWTAAFTTATNSINTGTKHAYGVNNIVQNTGPIDREDGYSFGYSGQTGVDPVTGADRRKIGILHRRAGKAEIRSLTITVAPTGNQTATITIDGVIYTVNLVAGTTAYTANSIANQLKADTTLNNTWDIEGCNSIVSFTYYSPGPKGGTYSFSSTGAGTLAVGTWTQTAVGVTPSDTWTYVDDWENQDIEFDPTKLNVFGVDFRWLGSGRVRFFMEDPATGRMTVVHTRVTTSQNIYPHINKPSLRLVYRSGTTNPAITPSQNVIVSGASVFAAIQGVINQTGGSQAWYNIDSSSRAKDLVHHLMSLQNPYVRAGGVNKASILLQNLTVATQNADPCVIYVVKNAIGTSDLLVFQSIPNTTVSMFAQYSVSAVTENLTLDRITNIQTLGINSNAEFSLENYNLSLAPGETVSVFISSSNAISRSAIGFTWNVD